uniref:Nodule inception protein n=1 Tax=Parasponia rugosa TaxID=1603294 RepID=A0A221I0T0_9ROSA|nr:nodule inception protein [Parasponia rugosa]
MEYGAMMPSNAYGTSFSDATMEVDFMDQLLLEGCWDPAVAAAATGLNFTQPAAPCSSAPRSLIETSHYMPSFESSNTSSAHLITTHHHQIYQDHQETEEGSSDHLQENHSSESNNNNFFMNEANEVGKRLWIGPRPNPGTGPCSSVKERLTLAIDYLKECTRDRDVLIQIWVPIRRGGRQILTTYDQPYSLDPNCKSLASYRMVSREYQFLCEEDSAESVGLPSQAFLGKLPEWTPDVRYFRSYEYPRINYAKQYNVRGSLALPIFERGNGTCLGVVEIVMTTQKVNYRPELEYVCQALEAVDLRSSQNFSPPAVKVCDELYQAALSEIVEVLVSVCKIHRLPLALTWAPCHQQGKGGCRHSDENYTRCVSTVDLACFVSNLEILGFHEACSEHHLFRGQGIVGTAFTTNKPCFATDITAFSKTEYPLSHHARMFGLRAAVAIPLRSVYTSSSDFVLEFFLPKDCQDPEEQKQMLNSLSIVIQQACRSLHVVEKELEEEQIMLPIGDPAIVASSEGGLKLGTPTTATTTNTTTCPVGDQSSGKESSWVAHMMEAQQQGRGVSVSLDYLTEEPKEEFRVTTHWDNLNHGDLSNGQVFSDFGQLQQCSGSNGSIEGGIDSYSFGGRRSSGARKAGEKRRTKTEKTISLPVLRQYFAGSLKDAAKSIGVCPTTLKRICRQHGITRWPSRKIKKVGHSLRKLQLVIDSVQGAEGAIQIGSFYSSFPQLNSPKFQGNSNDSFSSISPSDHHHHHHHLNNQSNSQPESGFFIHGSAMKSSPSMSSQASGLQQSTTTFSCFNGDPLITEDPSVILKRACSSDEELFASNQDKANLLSRSQSYKALSDQNRILDQTLLPLPDNNERINLTDGFAFRVKANFGEKKIRFSLPPKCSFRDLQLEIMRRFALDDITMIDIKYLDDDREWVLLTCNADLQECLEIHRQSQNRTMRICLQQAPSDQLIEESPFGSSSSPC